MKYNHSAKSSKPPTTSWSKNKNNFPALLNSFKCTSHNLWNFSKSRPPQLRETTTHKMVFPINNTAFENSIASTNHKTNSDTINSPIIIDHEANAKIPKTINITTKKKPKNNKNKNNKQKAVIMIHNYYTQRDLQSWLKTQQQPTPIPTPPTANPNNNPTGSQNNTRRTQPTNPEVNTPSTQPNQTTLESTTYQSTLLPPKRLNEHWGDPPTHTQHTFRLIMKNVNTISTIDGYVQWKATAHAADQLHANVLCLQEPNTNWHPNITSQVQASNPTEIFLTIQNLNLIQLRQQQQQVSTRRNHDCHSQQVDIKNTQNQSRSKWTQTMVPNHPCRKTGMQDHYHHQLLGLQPTITVR